MFGREVAPFFLFCERRFPPESNSNDVCGADPYYANTPCWRAHSARMLVLSVFLSLEMGCLFSVPSQVGLLSIHARIQHSDGWSRPHTFNRGDLHGRNLQLAVEIRNSNAGLVTIGMPALQLPYPRETAAKVNTFRGGDPVAYRMLTLAGVALWMASGLRAADEPVDPPNLFGDTRAQRPDSVEGAVGWSRKSPETRTTKRSIQTEPLPHAPTRTEPVPQGDPSCPGHRTECTCGRGSGTTRWGESESSQESRPGLNTNSTNQRCTASRDGAECPTRGAGIGSGEARRN